MFIELSKGESKELINVSNIIRIEAEGKKTYAPKESHSKIWLIGQPNGIAFDETYDEVKQLIEQAIGKGIPFKDNSGSSYEGQTLTSF